MRYDSVSFYLPGSRVRVFGRGQQRELIAHLESNPDTLVLIKAGRTFDDVVRNLPPGVRLDTRQRGGAVMVARAVHLADDPGVQAQRQRRGARGKTAPLLGIPAPPPGVNRPGAARGPASAP
jgi:hypothetical protein